jgi:hypothetical protein
MNETPRLTYLGSEDLKAQFLSQLAEHERLDQFEKGTYGHMDGTFRGCGIGCSLHSLNVLQGKTAEREIERTGDHARYETELGIPVWLAYLEDHLFEALSGEESRTWPRTFAEAIPVGVTIPRRLLAKILRWTLVAEPFGVRHATDDAKVIAIVDRMAALFDRELAGDSPTQAEWNEAARDAWTAWAAWDAWAAWGAWAAGGAWAARDAWALHNGAHAAACSTALARYVVDELRALGHTAREDPTTDAHRTEMLSITEE